MADADASKAARRVRTNRLLLEVATGDRRAVGALYDEVSPVLYGIIVKVVRDRSIAEEIAQDVFVEIWKRAERFDPERGSALSWMITIAHRRAIDAVRRQEASRRRDERSAARDATAGFDVVVDAVEQADERERVRRALAELTDVQREAVTLAYYDGFTYREVAERLGAPLGTVKSRMRDGLLRLERVLGAGNG